MRPAEQVYAELASVLAAAFPDRDYSGPVDASTRLMADVGLASIELIVLAERLEQHYGRKLPFGPFLAGLRTRGAADLELGELVGFLQQHIA